ncbi:MAG TPA: hypothetical protein VES20_13420 [Bryobacteraceae bacterium]|nr:hypothetical protein [Bryobacteraceae bacterium]
MSQQQHHYITAMFVSPLGSFHTSLASVLSNANVVLDHEASAERALNRIRTEQLPVVLLTWETDWHVFVARLREMAHRPSLILLLAHSDPALWAEALQAGFVEAIPVQSDCDRLLAAVSAAYRRWQRLQLVRAALDQNPMANSDMHGIDALSRTDCLAPGLAATRSD